MKLLGKEISGIFTVPSGIVTTNLGVIKKFANEIPQVGVLTTKSIGLLPKPGNMEPIYAEIPEEGSYVNAVGLGNPGCEAFRDELKNVYPLKNRFLLVSIFDSTPEGMLKVAQTLEDYADAFELNFSCPHAEKGYGMDIGSSCELTEKYIRFLKEKIKIPIFVKLTPNVTNFGEIVEAAINAGADGITAINTVGPLKSDVLSHGKGGMSGKGVKQKAIECVRIARETTSKLGKKDDFPIIGMGGISNADDAREFLDAGATIIGIGSSLTGFDTEKTKKFFKTISADLENNTNNSAEFILQKKIMHYNEFKVTKIEEVDHDLRIFHFDKPIPDAKPGNFVFCWIQGIAEKPFSIAYNNPLMLVIRAVGPFTKKMFEFKIGDTLKVRGPYGKHYDTEKMKDAVLVGGGTGIAPIYFLAKSLAEKNQKPSGVFIGGRHASQIILEKEFRKICQTFVSTDDGSAGFKGFVTELLKSELEKGLEIKSFSAAGPEIMMLKSGEIAKKYIPEEMIFMSIERYYKCGVGICGVCECDGLRSCIDGPIMTLPQIKNDFGHYHRDKTGKKINY